MKAFYSSAILVLLASALSTTSAGPLQAQRPPSPRAGAAAQAPASSGGMGFFMIGVQRLELEELQQRMQAAGYPTLDRNLLTFGGGGLAVRNRLLIGGEGHGLVAPSGTALGDQFRTRLSGGYGLFDLGYLLLSDTHVDLYPVIGIGGGGLSIEILERGAPSFDEVLRNPRRSTRLTSAMLVLDASLGVTYRTAWGAGRGRARGRGGLAVGLRGGYTFSPVRGEWQVDNVNDVAGGPDALLRGAYIRASIGGWGRR